MVLELEFYFHSTSFLPPFCFSRTPILEFLSKVVFLSSLEIWSCLQALIWDFKTATLILLTMICSLFSTSLRSKLSVLLSSTRGGEESYIEIDKKAFLFLAFAAPFRMHTNLLRFLDRMTAAIICCYFIPSFVTALNWRWWFLCELPKTGDSIVINNSNK